MAIALQQYINKLQLDPPRTTNMFEMYVTTGYGEIDNVLQHITLYGQGFEIPTRTTNYSDVSFKGYAFPIPTSQQMGTEHNITVNADTDGEIRRAFLAWQSKTWDPDIEGGSILKGDRLLNPSSFIRIQLLGSDMESISEVYKMVGVRIAEVGSLQVSNVDSNVSQFTVSFRSTYWQIEKGTVKQGAFSEQV